MVQGETFRRQGVPLLSPANPDTIRKLVSEMRMSEFVGGKVC